MSQDVTPTINNWTVKVAAFLQSIVPVGTQVIRAPVNRAAVPKAPCVIYTVLFQKRLRTNLHTDVDTFPTPGGAVEIEMGTEEHLQIDFYGPNAGDWCAATAMLWRDEYGCNMLNPEASPLYTDDARMVPLVTGEEQYLERYVLTAVLQTNPVTTVSQQFADTANVGLINVDSTYPP